MKNVDLNKLALFPILLLMSTPLQASTNYYCWKNVEDVQECGNYVPAQYSQKGFWQRLKSGTWEYIDPAPSAEEIAELERQKEKRRRIEAQRKEDDALRELFSTERDIEESRDGILDSIAAQIRPIETTLNVLKENLKDLEKSKELSENNTNVSDSQRKAIQRDIDRVTKRIQDNEAQLQNKRQEENAVNEKYDTYIERFRNIKKRRRNATTE
jgi:DNA repair exonuclease SbcCD ATPase subunit